MSSASEPRRAEAPVEGAVALALVGLIAGILADDVVVGLVVFLLALLVYLVYRILRAVELIAAKL